MDPDSCSALEASDAVGGRLKFANCSITRHSCNVESNNKKYSGNSVVAVSDGPSATARPTHEGHTEDDVGLCPNPVARLNSNHGSAHRSGDTGNMTSNEACFLSFPRNESSYCSMDGTSMCNSALKDTNDISSDDSNTNSGSRTVPSVKTLRRSEPTSPPQLEYGPSMYGSLGSTGISQRPKRRDLFNVALLHRMECPASFTANNGSSGGFHPQGSRGPATDGTPANPNAYRAPAVVVLPPAGFEHGVIAVGGDSEMEKVLGAGSELTPVIDNEQLIAKQGPLGRSATTVHPQGVTARANLDVERGEKTPAAELLAGRVMSPKNPGAARAHFPQSAAAPEERRTGAVVMTPCATVERHSLEQRLGREVHSDHSIHSNAVSSDISPSVLYDGGEARESATPAVSLLQHFLQHQRQQRLSFNESLRRRCSDAAALSRAVFRRSSLSSRKEGCPASLMQPQSPQQQLSKQTQQLQDELTSERYAVDERSAAPSRALKEMRGEPHASEERVGRLSREGQRRFGPGRRASRAAVSTRANQDRPAGASQGTATRWSEVTDGGNHVLSRYSDNSHSSRDRINDSDGSSSRSGSGDSRKHVRLHVLQTQQRKQVSTADVAAAAADAQASTSGFLVGKGRRSLLSTATEEERVNRQGLLGQAENERQRKVSMSQQQAGPHPAYHIDVPLEKEEPEPDEDAHGLQLTWSPSSSYATLPQQQEAGDRPSWGNEHVKTEQPPAQQIRHSTSGHRGSRSFPFSFFRTGSRHISAVPEGRVGQMRQGAVHHGVNGAVSNKQHPERPLSISRSSRTGEIEVLHYRPVGAVATALDEVSASSPYLGVSTESPPVAADSVAAGVSAALGSAGRWPTSWERGSDASKGRIKPAPQTEVLRKGSKQEEDFLRNLQARSPPSMLPGGDTAAEDTPSVGRRKNNLLSWLGWRRRQQKKETEASSDALGLGDVDKATMQMANAAAELPHPHTSLLLPLREQRARRLRTHVIIEIKDGLHQILEVQVAEVLRMLEQQCEADEQQQLLYLAERRRRRAGRCRARLRGHRHDTSGETTTSDSSSSSSSSCKEDTTTETFSHGQHRRYEVGRGGQEYSGDFSMPLLFSPERIDASQKASSGCSSPQPQGNAFSIDHRREAHVREIDARPAAAASPHGTKRMRRRPLSVRRKGEDFDTSGYPVHRSAMRLPLLPQVGTPELLAREQQPRKQTTRDQHIQQTGDWNSVPDEDVKAAAIASMLRGAREDRNPLPPSTSATGVSSTVACSTNSNHAESSGNRRELLDGGCRSSSRRNETACQISGGGKGGEGSTKRSSKKETAFCGVHRCCGGASRTSSSVSMSTAGNDGRGNTRRKSTCAPLSCREIKKENDRGCKDEAASLGRGQKVEELPLPTKSTAKLTSSQLLRGSRSNRKEAMTSDTICRCNCACCGGKSSTGAAVERWCTGCCKACCCCRKCLCERCRGGAHLKKVKRRVARGRAELSLSRTSSLSSLSAAIEQQHRYLRLLQQQQREQQQQHWQQLKRQQTARRSKGKAGPDTGRLTYRDCRQAFTDVHPIPSIEVRRHVVLVCLPPVTCFVLWDRVFLLMTDDLEPDQLISQLSKLTRHYTALERKNKAAESGAASPQSQKDRQQVAGEAERQQQQRESLQQRREMASQGPREETRPQQGAPHFSAASFPVSMKEGRLLQEHICDDPSPQHPATVSQRRHSQLRYQQLLESQQQLLPQHGREKNEGHLSMQQRWRLRSCYSSDDVPEALLEDVEEAVAFANEASAVRPVRTEISRSHAAHDPRTSIGSLSCLFAEHPQQTRQQVDPQQLYPQHSAFSGSVDSLVGQNCKYITQTREEAAEGLPRAQQQGYQPWPSLHRDASPILYEGGKVAVAPGCSSSLGTAEVSSCGMRQEELHPSHPGRSETSAALQQEAHHEAPYPEAGGRAGEKQVSKEAVFQCVPRLQTSPLCGAVTPEGVITSSSSAALSHHIWEQTPAQTAGRHHRQQVFYGAAGAASFTHVPPTPPPPPSCVLRAPVAAATASAVLRSGAPVAEEHADAAASLLTNEQLTSQQQPQIVEQQIFQFRRQQQHQRQQRERKEASVLHEPGAATLTRKQSGMHCVPGCEKSDGGANEITAPQEAAAARGGSDSNERLSCERVSSSSLTRSRCPSIILEKRRGTSSGRRSMPFEFAALECIFFAAFQQLNFDIVYLEKKFAETQQRAAKKSEASSILMEGLHSLKEPVALYEDRVTAFDKAFDELLSNNVDLHRMELTRLHHNPGLYDFDPHKDEVDPELEILLEYFDQEMDQFKGRVRHLKEGIDNTERLISLRLALMRNRLIQWELAAAVVAAGIAIGTCISGIFGMNLSNGYEDGKEHSHTMFTIISAVIAVLAVGSVAVVLYLIRTIVL